MHIPILYEDNHVIVIEKPAGIPSQMTPEGKEGAEDRIRILLEERDNKPGERFIHVVHRLDTVCSGILVLAKTSKALSRLSKAIRERQVRKRYLALVEGSMKVEPGAILRDFIDHKSMKATEGDATSKQAELVILSSQTLPDNTTLLLIELHTGRYHQIRFQLSKRGFPIVGDTKYGSKRPFLPNRIALHHTFYAFPHPTLKKEIAIHSLPHWQGITESLIHPLVEKNLFDDFRAYNMNLFSMMHLKSLQTILHQLDKRIEEKEVSVILPRNRILHQIQEALFHNFRHAQSATSSLKKELTDSFSVTTDEDLLKALQDPSLNGFTAICLAFQKVVYWKDQLIEFLKYSNPEQLATSLHQFCTNAKTEEAEKARTSINWVFQNIGDRVDIAQLCIEKSLQYALQEDSKGEWDECLRVLKADEGSFAKTALDTLDKIQKQPVLALWVTPSEISFSRNGE